MEVSRALKANLPVEEVILFGSKARGDDTCDSDMDLLVLLKGERPADASRRVWEVLWDVQMKHAVGLSPLVAVRRTDGAMDRIRQRCSKN